MLALALSMLMSSPPNVVIIFCDDLGYGDLGAYNPESRIPTPHLDRMAEQGMRFTDAHSPSTVCTPTRYSILTGRMAFRTGFPGVFDGAGGPCLIESGRLTLPGMLRDQGYRTACYGKWHLGHHEQFLPMQHGFDDYYGLPYSNDMWPYHPGVRHLPMEERIKRWPHLPLIDKNEIINDKVTPKVQEGLTTDYTERAVDFINKNNNRPFFLYVPHSMVHVPLYVSDKFKGKSPRGLYGDVIMEIDWSVGQILQTLKSLELEEETLVIFTSDNGPWLSYGEHAGSALPLREGKGTALEGGQREPTILYYPGTLPQGLSVDTQMMNIDLLPTLAQRVGADLPKHPIDGKDVWHLWTGESTTNPHEAYYFYYHVNELHGVRYQNWKLYFPHRYRTLDGQPGGKNGLPAPYSYKNIEKIELYNLDTDLSETTDLAEQYPEVVAQIVALADQKRKELGDALTNQTGTGSRPAGSIDKE